MSLNGQNLLARAKAEMQVNDGRARGNERHDVNGAPPGTAEKEQPIWLQFH